MSNGDAADFEDEDHEIADQVWDRLGWNLDDGDPFDHKEVHMAKWTAEKRKKLSKSDFGDPAHSAFPIADQEDLEHAAELLHHAKNPQVVKARLMRIARRKGLKLPASWQKSTTMSDPAIFDIDTKGKPDGDEIVYHDALIFRVGDYPDKDFSLTTEEALVAVEQFEPVANELEHVNSEGQATILDGKLGSVRSVKLSDDGQEIRGEVAIPKWLDAVWQGKKQVSAVWDRTSKTLQRLGLVVKGRVTGAALMAAFADAHPKTVKKHFAAAHRTYSGAGVIQRVHDQCAESGAMCSAADSAGATYAAYNAKAKFHSASELKGIQKLHDLAVGHGATCHAMRSFNSSPKEGNVKKLLTKFRALFGDQVEVDETEAEEFLGELVSMAGGKKGQQNGLRPAGGNAVDDEKDEDEDNAAEVERDEEEEDRKDDPEDNKGRRKIKAAKTKKAAMSFADSDEAQEMRAEIAALKRDNLVGKITAAASAFADAEIAAKRALPGEKESMVAVFTQAALDDAENPTRVTFSGADGKPRAGSRVAALKVLYTKRASHMLFQEFVTTGDLPEGSTVLFHQDATKGEKKPTAERINSLLEHYDDLGQQAIARRKAKS